MAKSKRVKKNLAPKTKPKHVAAVRDTGTPETRRRLRQDQVAKLLEQGKLTRHQYDAADEIRTALMARMRSIWSRPSMTERVDCARGPGTPINRWTTVEERIIQHHYGPWTHLMKKPMPIDLHGRRIKIGNPLEVVVDVVWENLGTRQTDDRHHLPRGAAALVVRQGLEAYAVMAGWSRAAA